jgi:YesN/AraC family two-component response regulator
MPEPVKILFVDDEFGIRVTLPAILEMHGFAVTTTATVQEALSLIQSEKFNILLSDLNIGHPGDGFTVVSAMRRTQPDCHNFIITGYPDFETALQAIRSQVDDYFVKPANIPLLIESLRDRVARRPEPLQSKTTAAVLREKHDLIVQDWLQRLREVPGIMRIPLSEAERINNAPVMIAELSGCLERKEICLSESSSESAMQHGRIRHAQGYTIPMMVNEARHLENAIADCLQLNLLSLDLSSLIPDIFVMSNCFHLMLEESIRAFEEHAGTPAVA